MTNSMLVIAVIIALTIPFLIINAALMLVSPFQQTIGGVIVLVALAVVCHKALNKYAKWKVIEKST